MKVLNRVLREGKRLTSVAFVANHLHPNYSDSLRSLSRVARVSAIISKDAKNTDSAGISIYKSSDFITKSSWGSSLFPHRRRVGPEGITSPGALRLIQHFRNENIDAMIIRRENRRLYFDARLAAAFLRIPHLDYYQSLPKAGLKNQKNCISPICHAGESHVPSFVPLGVDLSNRFRKTAELIDIRDHLKVMAVGRMWERRGYRVLLDALAEASQEVPIHLSIYGAYGSDANNPQEFRRKISKSNPAMTGTEFNGKVDFMDFVPRSEMHEHYINNHLYIYSGWVNPEVESARNTIERATGQNGTRLFSMLEAMRAGLPVIVSADSHVVGALNEGRNGFMFEKGDPKDLAQKIKLFLRCDAASMGDESRKIVENVHDASHFPIRLKNALGF